MPQRRQLAAHFGDFSWIDFADHDAFTLGQIGKNFTPGVDQKAVPPGSAAVFMLSALSGGEHITLVLHRTGAQQQFPMRAAGGVSESGRHDQKIDHAQSAKEFGEAQVVADRQPDLAPGGAKARRRVAGLELKGS